MRMLRSWQQIADVVEAVTIDGPLTTPSVVRAATQRLRLASEWSNKWLGEISGFPDSAQQVIDSPTYVVDRYTVNRQVARTLNQMLPIDAEGMGATLTFGGAAGLRHLINNVQEAWLPVTSGSARFLIAPNVWEIAVAQDMDHGDYARWVALRSGIWGVLFTEAPWLTGYITHLLRGLPNSADELSRQMILLSEAVSGRMEKVTPSLIPSVAWIRRYTPRSGVIQLLGQVRFLRVRIPDLLAIRLQANQFVHEVGIPEDPANLGILLTSPDYLPTEDELFSPRQWLNRVAGR